MSVSLGNKFPRAVTDDDIRMAITTGDPAGMPPFALKAEELDNLVAFVRSGMDRTGTEFRLGDARRGKAIYDKAGCAACHRLNGNGPRTAPVLDDIGFLPGRADPDVLYRTHKGNDADQQAGHNYHDGRAHKFTANGE